LKFTILSEKFVLGITKFCKGRAEKTVRAT